VLAEGLTPSRLPQSLDPLANSVDRREFHVALLERMWGVDVLPIVEILFEGVETCEVDILWAAMRRLAG
jgi:hypothetical protein